MISNKYMICNCFERLNNNHNKEISKEIRDCNGKAIYEGCIIKVEQNVGEKRIYNGIVYYNPYIEKFEAYEICNKYKYIHDMHTISFLDHFEIIGLIVR